MATTYDCVGLARTSLPVGENSRAGAHRHEVSHDKLSLAQIKCGILRAAFGKDLVEFERDIIVALGKFDDFRRSGHHDLLRLIKVSFCCRSALLNLIQTHLTFIHRLCQPTSFPWPCRSDRSKAYLVRIWCL